MVIAGIQYRPTRVIASIIAMAMAMTIFGGGADEATAQPLVANEVQAAAYPAANPSTQGMAFPLPKKHSKLVFAHYVESFPLSLDNRAAQTDYYACEYMTIDGKEHTSDHSAYGGWLRDRPPLSSPKSGNYLVANAKAEINSAKAAGIDGFALNLSTLKVSGTNTSARVGGALLAAAHSKSFKILLQPDTDSLAQGGITSTGMADGLAAIAKKYPKAVHKIGGKVVVSPFYADKKSTKWWTAVLKRMKSKKVSAVLWPLISDYTKMAAFSKISIGLSEFGVFSTRSVKNREAFARNAHTGKYYAGAGKSFKSGHKVKWMQPIIPQLAKPKNGQYGEAGNTATLRAAWSRAISGKSGVKNDKADMALLVTWNDFSETTQFGPSVQHGNALLDINAYYMSRFQSGSYPKITRDVVYLSHRMQFHSQKPANKPARYTLFQGYPHKATVDGSTPADKVEVLAFLTSATKRTVKLQIGGTTTSYTIKKKGVSVISRGLANGMVSAALFNKSGKRTASVASPRVVGAQRQEDLGYWFESSRRKLPTQQIQWTNQATCQAKRP